MKKLRVVLTGLILLFAMQFTLVSCEDNSEIIKSEDGKIEYQKTGHGEVGDPPYDDDDEEQG